MLRFQGLCKLICSGGFFLMKTNKSEKGQALILIVFAIVGLIGITALAVDGGIAYANRQDAQNATDSAALAGGLAHARGNDINTAAMNRAAINTYNNDGTTNTVTVAVADTPAGECPGNQPGKDITVTITAKTDTYFGPVVGINQVTNKVTATARSCGSYNAPMILGNAVVGLRPTGTDFDAHGIPDWTITGGGIFSNSSSGSSATCGGSAGVTSPSATAVGGSNLNSCGVNNANITRGATQLQPSDYTSLLPRVPACNGTATLSGGQWHPQSGRDGSNVAFSGDMDFESGLYCVTNSPGPFHGQITGNGVTFYIADPSFSMKFNGGGNVTAQAPMGDGEYHGVLMFSAPQFVGGILQCNQEMDMRGNGTADIIGSIIMPSTTITMFGNSGTGSFHTQVIGCAIDSGGNADISINYSSGQNYTPPTGATIQLLK
jgi:Flp pilus assembly protein TadG